MKKVTKNALNRGGNQGKGGIAGKCYVQSHQLYFSTFPAERKWELMFRKEEVTLNLIKPEQLPKLQIFLLNSMHKTELGNFVVMYDGKSEILYINKIVPPEDINKFVEIVTYSGKYLNSDNEELMDYVYEKYKWEAYNILVEAWRTRNKKRKDMLAKQFAEEICRAITKMIEDDRGNDDSDARSFHSLFMDNERLLYQIYRIGSKMGNEKKWKTPDNLMDIGREYTFIYAYLLGKGEINPDWQQEVEA